jgi:hypothetical protein
MTYMEVGCGEIGMDVAGDWFALWHTCHESRPNDGANLD